MLYMIFTTMIITCKKCSQQFECSEKQMAFLEKVSPVTAQGKQSLPAPTLCPPCREQLRLTFRNEKNLYRRTCDVTGKDIISIYTPEGVSKVVDRAYWWSDDFDAKKYGRDVDFQKPFFEQYGELFREVPRMALLNMQSENSDFTNAVSHNKDCYMLFSADFNRNVLYSNWMVRSEDSLECTWMSNSQLCYQCIWGDTLYDCKYCINCSDTRESAFCFQCKNVSNCLFCTNLRGKQYCIFNKQYTKEEYEKKKAELDLGSYKIWQWALREFQKMMQQAIVPNAYLEGKCEEVQGNFIRNCKNIDHGFDVADCQNLMFGADAYELKDVIDFNVAAMGELGYLAVECAPLPTGSIGVINCYGGSNVYYSFECMNSKNLFGCVGLKKAEYCIFNKQYTKEEYEALMPQVITLMRRYSEWGEFFPAALSPFCYNETNAQEFYPREQSEALKQGFRWRVEMEKTMPVVDAVTYFDIDSMPDNIRDIDQEILKKIFVTKAGKALKIAPQELALY